VLRDDQSANFAVTITGIFFKYLPFESGIHVVEGGGACGMDTVAIKSYPS
jgi:hypothetical protein